MLLKLELFLAVSAKSDADFTSLLAQSIFAQCFLKCNIFFLYSSLHLEKYASMLRRLKKYQESGLIKDARAVVVLRTGNTCFPNVASCLFIGKDVGLLLLILEKMWDYVHKLLFEHGPTSFPTTAKITPICEKKDAPNYKSNFILLTAICIAN